ncbi:MAG: MarR family transcriptional regulator [Oscillospiraceae bacterium]|nr:MarR family transcriptional regulator [Oscillospiraceae bacterium]
MSISKEILHEYLQVSRQIVERFRVIYGKLNLTYPQSIVLAILECDGPMPISALADAAGSANSTISGVVDRLEKLNLVQRIRSETDRRVIYVSTTDQFRDHFSEVRNSAVDRFTFSLKDVSEEDAATILKGLQLLRQAVSEE